MFRGIKHYVTLKICFVLLGFLVLLGCNSSIHSETAIDPKAIATVNGEPIVEAEYRLAQNIATFNKKAQRDQTLERIVQVKLIQLEGVKYGLLSSASYASFLIRFNKENERRAQAIENKQVIYGPRQYTEENYYNDQFSRLEIRLKEVLSQKSLDLSERTLKQQYESSKQDYALQPTIVLKVMIEPMQSDSSGALERINALQQEIIAGKEIDELYNSRKSDSTKVAEITINEDNKREYMKYREEFFIKALEMQVGQFSPIFIDQGNYIILYCSSRAEMGYKTFNEVRDEVYLKTIDKQFQVHVEGQRESANVQFLR